MVLKEILDKAKPALSKVFQSTPSLQKIVENPTLENAWKVYREKWVTGHDYDSYIPYDPKDPETKKIFDMTRPNGKDPLPENALSEIKVPTGEPQLDYDTRYSSRNEKLATGRIRDWSRHMQLLDPVTAKNNENKPFAGTPLYQECSRASDSTEDPPVVLLSNPLHIPRAEWEFDNEAMTQMAISNLETGFMKYGRPYRALKEQVVQVEVPELTDMQILDCGPRGENPDHYDRGEDWDPEFFTKGFPCPLFVNGGLLEPIDPTSPVPVGLQNNLEMRFKQISNYFNDISREYKEDQEFRASMESVLSEMKQVNNNKGIVATTSASTGLSSLFSSSSSSVGRKIESVDDMNSKLVMLYGEIRNIVIQSQADSKQIATLESVFNTILSSDSTTSDVALFYYHTLLASQSSSPRVSELAHTILGVMRWENDITVSPIPTSTTTTSTVSSMLSENQLRQLYYQSKNQDVPANLSAYDAFTSKDEKAEYEQFVSAYLSRQADVATSHKTILTLLESRIQESWTTMAPMMKSRRLSHIEEAVQVTHSMTVSYTTNMNIVKDFLDVLVIQGHEQAGIDWSLQVLGNYQFNIPTFNAVAAVMKQYIEDAKLAIDYYKDIRPKYADVQQFLFKPVQETKN